MFERLFRELVEAEARYRQLVRPILDREQDRLAARWGTWLTSDKPFPLTVGSARSPRSRARVET